MAKKNKTEPVRKGNPVTTGTPEEKHKWRNTFVIGAIIIYTFFVFADGLDHQFVTWDDPDYLTQNILIRDFSFNGFVKIFTTPVIGMYNPIPFVLYTIQYKLWGLNPVPYNVISLLLHIMATILVYKFIFRLSARYEVAGMVAILFAIHPMHVSVVMWASQTKTSLYLIFYFAAMLLYLKYVQDGYKIKYIVYASVLLILSALSKPSAVTMAPMLFLLDYYLGRKIDKRLFLEKIPFFAIALVFGILTLLTHSEEGDSIFEVERTYSLINNLIISNYSIVFYLEKFLIPKNLSTIYPYPDNGILPIRYYLAIPAIPLILLAIWKARNFRKELVFGLLFFVVAISVMLRPVPSGFFGTANRYSYLSYTGFFFIVGQLYVYLSENRFNLKFNVMPYVHVLLIFFLGYCTYKTVNRVEVWDNSISLFTDVIKKNPKLTMAYSHRASAKSLQGDYQGALEDITIALQIDTNFAEGYNNSAVFKDAMKDYQGALADCNRAIAISPNFTNAHINKANVEFHMGRLQEALAGYNKAVELDSTVANTFFNRGLVRITLQDTLGALTDWKKAEVLGIPQARQMINTYGYKYEYYGPM